MPVTAAELQAFQAKIKALEAQMNLWIYPDGTVHEHARRLSIATMARLAKSKKEEKSRDKS